MKNNAGLESRKYSLTDLSARPVKYFSQAREEITEFIPKTARLLLDVGCGDGSFGMLVKKTIKAEVWGVELNNEAASIARTKIDNVLTGDISKVIADLPDSKFDCIVFNDVLEHLADPFNVLLEIKKKLSAKGAVVCSMPNVRFIFVLYRLLIEKQWRYEDAGVLDKTHLRFFTKKSIIDMLEILGYKILKIKGIHGIRLWKFWLLNVVSLGYLNDTRYEQFVCVAKPV